jgi:ribosomal protein L37AE/L43A
MLALRAWNGHYRVNLVETRTRVGSVSSAGNSPRAAPLRPQGPAGSMAGHAPAQPRGVAPAPKTPALRRRPLGLPPALALLGSRPRKSADNRTRGLGLPPALAGRPRPPTKAVRTSAATLTLRRPPKPAAGRVRPRKSVRPRARTVGSSRVTGGAYGPRNVLRRRRAVRLAAYEEHRCPYCLEPVRRGDPRGTVECPICHTLHHKDCWHVTGSCQIPHLTS